MTLFPDMVRQGVTQGILYRAMEAGYLHLFTYQIRDYSADKKHHSVDDYTYGGGAGMLMQAQPIYDCFLEVRRQVEEGKGQGKPCVIYVTPQGQLFTQQAARELAKEDNLIFLCGHYEGVDERVIEEIGAEPYSIGDYVLTGGELASMVMIDAIARLVPGVLHNEDSAVDESFTDGLLEYPQYSRPEVWRKRRVPEILLSGDHGRVDAWRLSESVQRTKERRPELYAQWMQAHPDYGKPKKKRKSRRREGGEDATD